MGDVIYVRTEDGVLLRFEDPAMIRKWLESGRLSRTDRYLAADQRWRPVTELLGTDPVGIAPIRDEAPQDQTGGEVRQVTSEARPAEHEAPKPQQVADPTAATRPLKTVQVQEQKVSRDRSDAWAVDVKQAPVQTLWASDPEDSVYVVRQRRRLIALAVAGVTVVAAVVAFMHFSHQGSAVVAPNQMHEVMNSPKVEPEPAVAQPALPDSAPVQENAQASAKEVPVEPELKQPATQPPEPRGTKPGVQAARSERRDTVVVAAPKAPESSEPTKKASPADFPDTYEGHMAAGNKLILTDPAKAAVHYQAAARLAPGRVEPLHRLGDCEFAMGDYKAAASHYEEVLKIRDYGPSIIGLARVHLKMNNIADARYYYSKYLEVNPNGSQAEEARRFLNQ